MTSNMTTCPNASACAFLVAAAAALMHATWTRHRVSEKEPAASVIVAASPPATLVMSTAPVSLFRSVHAEALPSVMLDAVGTTPIRIFPVKAAGIPSAAVGLRGVAIRAAGAVS
jgi:hypothetical protein